MTQNKIKKLSCLKNIVRQLQKKRKTVVFTNGCFDILHLGHIRYLEKARALGDCLIVAVNSDFSVRRLKGESRPVFGDKERAAVLAALQCVDYVVVFADDTPLCLIESLRPDVLVKGGDWKISDIVGSKTVFSYGGKVRRIGYIKGYSTTSAIARIAAAYPARSSLLIGH